MPTVESCWLPDEVKGLPGGKISRSFFDREVVLVRAESARSRDRGETQTMFQGCRCEMLRITFHQNRHSTVLGDFGEAPDGRRQSLAITLADRAIAKPIAASEVAESKGRAQGSQHREREIAWFVRRSSVDQGIDSIQLEQARQLRIGEIRSQDEVQVVHDLRSLEFGAVSAAPASVKPLT